MQLPQNRSLPDRSEAAASSTGTANGLKRVASPFRVLLQRSTCVSTNVRCGPLNRYRPKHMSVVSLQRYFCRRTALHYAADANQLGVAEVLVPARAGVNVRDDNGGTPLHYASAQGHSALVQFLLRNGAVAQVISVPMAQPKGAPQVSFPAMCCAVV